MAATASENYHVTNQGAINIAGDDSSGILGTGSQARIDNSGSLEMHGFRSIGIEAIGSRAVPSGENISIVNAGHITTVGDLGIGVALGLPPPNRTATDSSIINSGVIETNGDGAAGVLMLGDGNHLTNSGRITTDGAALEDDVGLLHAAGVLVSGHNALVQNSQTGVIQSKNTASAAVELDLVERTGVTNADTSSTLDNLGFIKGAAIAVLGGDGQETVINHGQIVGDVVLGGGADTFVFGKDGSLAGDLYLGGGDDLVRIEKGAGTAHIADFAAGPASGDVIAVSAFFSSFGELAAHSSQHGTDVVIDLGHKDQLILEHLNLGALTAGDFLFV
jgi:hypothetical protein